MKVLLISKAKGGGGAAIAAYRLLLALQKQGVDAKMLVQADGYEEEGIFSTSHSAFKRGLNFLRFVQERLIFLTKENSPAVRFLFSLANTGEDLTKNPNFLDADVIHLHWINAGFLSLRTLKKILKSGKPVVWTFHDEWPYTGGCHLALDCREFTRSCGMCPYLKRPGVKDLSSRIWNRKERLFRNAEFNVIAPSKWLQSRIEASSLLGSFNLRHIPNVVDTNVFRPVDKEEAARRLGLKPETRYILFGAPSMKSIFKGFEFFREAVHLIHKELGNDTGIEILLFGKSYDNMDNVFPFKTRHAGMVQKEEQMVDLYSVADVYVNPSLQESFGFTVLESMLCGTPVVGFGIGAFTEIINHKENGYLALTKSTEDLAEGMKWIFTSADTDMVSERARTSVLERFPEEDAATAHISLYKSIVTGEQTS